MSLTRLLTSQKKSGEELRTLLMDLFPTPKFKSSQSMKVRPSTTHHLLIGTAYDYLLRFTLKQRYKKQVYETDWVSERALKHFKNNRIDFDEDPSELDYGSLIKLFEDKAHKNEQIIQKFSDCKKIYQDYIKSKLKNLDAIIEASLFLSRLDNVYRIGRRMIPYMDRLPDEEEVIDELKQLLQSTDMELFEPNKKIVLNPEFGEGSQLVGGADGDLIVDNTLIEIKVTKDFRITRPIINQIIGYYLLYLIGGVSKHNDVKVDKLGIFFARHNHLWTINIDDIGDEIKFNETLKMFKAILKKK